LEGLDGGVGSAETSSLAEQREELLRTHRWGNPQLVNGQGKGKFFGLSFPPILDNTLKKAKRKVPKASVSAVHNAKHQSKRGAGPRGTNRCCQLWLEKYQKKLRAYGISSNRERHSKRCAVGAVHGESWGNAHRKKLKW